MKTFARDEHGVIVVLFLVLSVLSLTGTPVSAQPPVRRIFVPADRPEVRPPGDWRPVLLSDLEKYLAGPPMGDAASRAALIRADYSATLVGSELQQGRLEWMLRRTTPGGTLDLAPLGLAVETLRWNDAEPAEATWGVTPQGRTLLVTEGLRDRLDGTWSLRGRRIGETVLFEVDLPRSTTTAVRLTLPDGWKLRSSAGDVQPPSVPGGAWEIRMGAHTRALWTISRMADAGLPLVLVQHESEYRIRQDGLRLRTAVVPEVLRAPASELILEVDDDLEVLAVVTADGTSLSWKPGRAPGQLIVRLPQPLIGPGPRLQVDAVGRFPSGRMASLPQVRVAGALLKNPGEDPASGRLIVRIASPLQVYDLKLTGCRQIEMARASDEEQFTFKQFDPACRIELELNRAESRAAARVLTWIKPDRDTWTSRTVAEWSVGAGSLFNLHCRIAPGWDVVDVRSGPAALESPEWLVTDEKDERHLTVVFPEPLLPGQSRRLIIEARRVMTGSDCDVPVVTPQGVSSGQVLIGVPDHAGLMTDEAGSFIPATLEAAWNDLAPLATLNDSSKAVWLRGPLPGAHGRLRAPAPRPPALVTPEPLPSTLPAVTRPARVPSVCTRLDVQSRWVLSGNDCYTARMSVCTDGRSSPFGITLPRDAVLLDVRVNGFRAVPERDGQRIDLVLDPLPPSANETSSATEIQRPTFVEVDYELPVQESFGIARRPIALPHPDGGTLLTTVQVQPEGDVWIGDLRGLDRGPSGNLVTRWLGPLGRNWLPTSTLSTVTAFGPDVPLQASLSICRSSRRAMASWSTCGLMVLLGWALRCRSPHNRHVIGQGISSSLILTVIVVLVVMLPEATAPLAGAAHAGFWLAILVPNRWLKTPPVLATLSDPAGPSRQAVIVTGGLLVLVAGTWTTARAQDPRPEQRPSVLIPVDGEGKPSGKTPLAYVPPALETAIRAALIGEGALPESLVRKTEFVLDWEPTGVPLIVARYEVLLRPSTTSVSVTLPLKFANLAGENACTVDGRVQPVVVGPTGSFVVVLDSAAAASSSETTAPGLTMEYQVHEIQLRVNPQADPAQPGGLRLGLQPVPQATLVRARADDRPVQVTSQATSTGLATVAKLTAESPLSLGPASLLRFSFGEQRTDTADLTVQPWTVCDVHPGYVACQTRFVGRVARGQFDAFVVRFPAAAAIRDVQSPDLLRWDVNSRGDVRLLHVALQRPQTADFSARITWVVPRTAESRSVALGSPVLTLDSETSGAVTPLPQMWAWRPTSDLVVDLRPAGTDSVQTRTSDQFLAAFLVEGPRPTGVSESAAPILWALDTKLPQVEVAVKKRQTVSVFRERIQVDFEAELTARSQLAFQHQLTIPADFAIDRVQALQDGAEQAVRWSRNGDQVTVFLSDRVRGTHKLRVSGLRPRGAGADEMVPLWRYGDASLTETEVVVWRSPDAHADVVGPETLVAIPVPVENVPPTGAALTVGAYRSQSDAPLQLHVSQPTPSLTAKTSGQITAVTKGWNVVWTMQFSVDSGQTEAVSIRLPPSLAQVAQVTTAEGRVGSRTREADGTEDCEIICHLEPGLSCTVEVRAPLADTGPDVELPVPVSLEAAPSPLQISVMGGTHLLTATPSVLLKVDHKSSRPAAGVRVSIIQPGHRRLALIREEGDDSVMAGCDTTLWRQQDRWVGRTLVTWSRGPRKTILTWPQGSVLTALVINGEPQRLPAIDNSELRLNLPPSVSDQEVLIGWSTEGTETPSPLPDVAHEEPDYSFVTWVPPDHYLFGTGRSVPGRLFQPAGKPSRDTPPTAFRIPRDSSPNRVALVDEILVRRFLAGFLAACVVLLGFVARRYQPLVAVQSRPWLAALILAVTWSLCFSPAWLGAAFAGAAVWEALLARRPKPVHDVPSTATRISIV